MRAQVVDLGKAAEYVLLGLANGSVSVNSASTVVGDFGYSAGVTSLTNQKIGNGYFGEWTGTAYVHSLIAAFHASADYVPTGGIVTNAAEDHRLDQANSDALGLSAELAGLAPTESLGGINDTSVSLGSVDNVRTVHIVSVSSLSMNADTLDLIGDADDVFVFNISGDFRFSQSSVRLTGGVTANHVLFHFLPTGQYSHNVLINKSATSFQGTILAPDLGGYAVEYHNPAGFQGAIIARDILVHSDFSIVHVPFTGCVCVGPQAVVNANFPACGLPQDPVLSAGQPVLGSNLVVEVGSELPNSLVFVLGTFGPTVATTMPGSNCVAWVDPQQFLVAGIGLTDGTGSWAMHLAMPTACSKAGEELTLQALILDNSGPGPIPGIPGWLSNGVRLLIGLL